jgi:hypothetical protein
MTIGRTLKMELPWLSRISGTHISLRGPDTIELKVSPLPFTL